MSTKTLKDERKLPKQLMFSKKCLGIVLKRIISEKLARHGEDYDGESVKNGELVRFGSDNNSESDDWMYESGFLIYQEFQEENRQCFWNTILVDSVSNVEYMGYVAPGTLLICGNEYYLEAVRSAWARRVLRSPANFIITRLGDVTGLEIQVIPQTQFTPLPEALCLVVSELNVDKQTASLDVIFSCLRERFSDMIIPNQEVVYSSLGKLIKDRKVYHTGDGYFIVTPETYHMTTMLSLPERPLLMSNEEAIHKLHGGELVVPSKTLSETRTRSIQTNMAASDEDLFLSPTVTKSMSSDRHLSMSKLDRTGSLRLSRKEKHRSEEDNTFIRSESMRLSPEKSRSLIKDINLKSSPVHREVEKGEKVSMFSKLFRRSSSKRRKDSKSPAKFATFSAQFPPTEWSDPDVIHYHSRSTQTLSKESQSLSPSKAALNVASPALMSSSSVSINHNNSNNNHQSAANNNIISSGNAHSNHHHRNCNGNSNAAITSPIAASTPITNAVSNLHTPIKCKTDSLTRLRDPDKSGSHYHHRGRSVNRLSGQGTDLKSQTDSSIDRPISSGLARKGSSSELNSSHRSHSTSGGQRSLINPHTSTRSSTTHLISPARFSKFYSSSRNGTQDSSKGGSGSKNLGNDSLRGTIVDHDSLHSSAASLNRVDLEAKVKNTDLRTDEEYKMADLPAGSNGFGSEMSLKKSSSKYSNRWSVHGAEAGSIKTTMNNVAAGSHKNGSMLNGKQQRIKCVNKLNHSTPNASSGSVSCSSQPNRSSNITAAVRPTQAIKPLNQYVNSEKPSGDKKIHNGEDVDACKLVSSPSFTKTFDLDSADFKSITAMKLLKGISVNSIDTLVEVNLVANEIKSEDDKEDSQDVVFDKKPVRYTYTKLSPAKTTET